MNQYLNEISFIIHKKKIKTIFINIQSNESMTCNSSKWKAI